MKKSNFQTGVDRPHQSIDSVGLFGVHLKSGEMYSSIYIVYIGEKEKFSNGLV